jgi:hypothetical protein
MSVELVWRIINDARSSAEWWADVARVPKEWQVQVEAVMAKVLGHGIHAAKSAAATSGEAAKGEG